MNPFYGGFVERASLLFAKGSPQIFYFFVAFDKVMYYT